MFNYIYRSYIIVIAIINLQQIMLHLSLDVLLLIFTFFCQDLDFFCQHYCGLYFTRLIIVNKGHGMLVLLWLCLLTPMFVYHKLLFMNVNEMR